MRSAPQGNEESPRRATKKMRRRPLVSALPMHPPRRATKKTRRRPLVSALPMHPPMSITSMTYDIGANGRGHATIRVVIGSSSKRTVSGTSSCRDALARLMRIFRPGSMRSPAPSSEAGRSHEGRNKGSICQTVARAACSIATQWSPPCHWLHIARVVPQGLHRQAGVNCNRSLSADVARAPASRARLRGQHFRSVERPLANPAVHHLDRIPLSAAQEAGSREVRLELVGRLDEPRPTADLDRVPGGLTRMVTSPTGVFFVPFFSCVRRDDTERIGSRSSTIKRRYRVCLLLL
jgi:hypothetical protein